MTDNRYCTGRALAARYAGILFLLALLLAASPAAAQNKFATSMFHFNIQYVAGGLEGFVPFNLERLVPGWELNEQEVEDMIIVESFEPVLDLYMRHPNWGVDIELQAYFIEVLAARHPGVLAKLKQMADSGQASVVSFHYSDQLFIAFGRPAWDKSIEFTEKVFADNAIPHSTTVFCQEGQAGQGMAQAMAEHGFETMVWPKNLWIYQHGDFDAQPYYSFGDVDMVVGAQGVNYNGGEVQLTWTFLGDGETLASCNFDPYFPPFFHANQQCLDDYENGLQALENDGWDIATVSQYVQAVKDLGVPPAPPPPLFDGTWQPDSTMGVFQWLGHGGLWRTTERDNHVRTTDAVAYRELMAAETVAAVAGLAARGALDEAWRILDLAMVSDASGINPYRGEIGYGVSRAADVAVRARAIIEEGKAALGITGAKIDTAANTVTEGTPPAESPEGTAPLDVTVDSARRETTSTWRHVSDSPTIDRLDIAVAAGMPRFLTVTFPGDSPTLTLTPALMDDTPVTFNRSDFVFDEWAMPLANGLVSLDDDLFIIKDQAYTHVAAFMSPANGNIEFRDDTATPNSAFTWRFYVFRGAPADAVAFANALNVHPTLYR